MSAVVKIIDESVSGKINNEFTLTLASTQVNVREIIEQRVRQEVEQFNQRKAEKLFSGLVQPTHAEQELNGFRLRKNKLIDVDKQIATAINAFESNGFFMLVDDKQVESLDEKIGITPNTKVSFLKLVTLVGG